MINATVAIIVNSILTWSISIYFSLEYHLFPFLYANNSHIIKIIKYEITAITEINGYFKNDIPSNGECNINIEFFNPKLFFLQI